MINKRTGKGLADGEIDLLTALVERAKRDLLRQPRTPQQWQNFCDSLDFFYNDNNPVFNLICDVAGADITEARKKLTNLIKGKNIEIPGLFACLDFDRLFLYPGQSGEKPGPIPGERPGRGEPDRINF